jgi:phosphosulfolactate phosphohydrolase-like enzyme
MGSWFSFRHDMKFSSYWLWDLPNILTGTVLVIDVFAATTNLAIISSKGPKRLFLANDQNIEQTHKNFLDAVVIGESNRLPRSFYEVSNSPRKIRDAELSGRVVIYSSINGTRAIENVLDRSMLSVLALSFTNIGIAVEYVRNLQTESITFITSGDEGRETVEDRACAETFVKLYNGEKVDWDANYQIVSRFVQDFYGKPPDYENIPLILSVDKYPVVPETIKNPDGTVEVRPARIP